MDTHSTNPRSKATETKPIPRNTLKTSSKASVNEPESCWEQSSMAHNTHDRVQASRRAKNWDTNSREHKNE